MYILDYLICSCGDVSVLSPQDVATLIGVASEVAGWREGKLQLVVCELPAVISSEKSGSIASNRYDHTGSK